MFPFQRVSLLAFLICGVWSNTDDDVSQIPAPEVILQRVLRIRSLGSYRVHGDHCMAANNGLGQP
jgi:hypothetical protein